MEKYISDVKLIDHNQQIVFEHLANFENLAEYLNSGLIEKITKQVPQVKITDFKSDRDSCKFNITGMGVAKIQIVNREPFKTIKVESSGGLPQFYILGSAFTGYSAANQNAPYFACRHEYDDKNDGRRPASGRRQPTGRNTINPALQIV